MRQIVALALSATLAAPVPSQDLLHYKFDSPCLTEVVNYATGTGRLQTNGVLEVADGTAPWTDGRFGSALAASDSVTRYHRVRSGWNPAIAPLTGDLTIAFFARSGAATDSGLTYLMGAPAGGFRLFTGGIAGNGLVQREVVSGGGNLGGNDLALTAVDFRAQATGRWVHVALVVDGTAGTATWFVDGAAAQRLTGVGPANVTLPGNFTVGYYTSGSTFDCDELLISRRAFTDAEVGALANAPRAGDGAFTSGVLGQCGNVTLRSRGGRPFLGNTGYGFEVLTGATGAVWLLLGFDRCTLDGARALPIDLGPVLPIAAGCRLLTRPDLTLTSLALGGLVDMSLPIPASPSLEGLAAYAQCAIVGASAIEASAGWAIALGR